MTDSAPSPSTASPPPSGTAPTSPHQEVQKRYASRIKERLAQPVIDVSAARDGMLDCYVSTYHAGLAVGIQGMLDIDPSEGQVARIAAALFRKRLAAHGASFEEPTVEALDALKQEVDDEMHFEQLPAEIRGVHDQVCSLMLAKADRTLDHTGDTSAVTAPRAVQPAAPAPVAVPVSVAPVSVAPMSAPTMAMRPHGTGPQTAAARQALLEAVEMLREDIEEGASARRISRAIRQLGTLASLL